MSAGYRTPHVIRYRSDTTAGPSPHALQAAGQTGAIREPGRLRRHQSPNLMTIEWRSVSQVLPAWNTDHRNRPGTRTSPAAGRNGDISHRFLSGPDCADERSSQRQERLAGLDSCARARTADRGLPIPAESRPRGSAGLACHASESMRSREDLDDLNTADSHRIEESMSLENPGVVRARLNVLRRASSRCRRSTWRAGVRRREHSGLRARRSEGCRSPHDHACQRPACTSSGPGAREPGDPR